MESFDELVKIVARLRAPDGCPWDRAQTHLSLRRCLVEETGEFLDAIEDNDDGEMREELGDLLLQVLIHSQIASETGRFCLDDVIREESAKLLYRHPHVFGDKHAGSEKEALGRWEEAKANDKSLQAKRQSLMDGVPRSIPALSRAQKALSKAAQAGLGCKTAEEALGQADAAFKDLAAAVKSGDRQICEQKLGEALWGLCDFARLCDFAAEDSLQQTSRAFMEHFRRMESVLKIRNLDLHSIEKEDLLNAWDETRQ